MYGYIFVIICNYRVCRDFAVVNLNYNKIQCLKRNAFTEFKISTEPIDLFVRI